MNWKQPWPTKSDQIWLLRKKKDLIKIDKKKVENLIERV